MNLDALYSDLMVTGLFMFCVLLVCLLVCCVQPWLEECRRYADAVNVEEV